jgi:hypothetical protein
MQNRTEHGMAAQTGSNLQITVLQTLKGAID